MEKFASNAVVYEIEAPQAGSHLGTYIMVPEAEAAGWECRPPTVAERDPMPEAAPACREYAATVPLPEMGRGAEKELRRRLDTTARKRRICSSPGSDGWARGRDGKWRFGTAPNAGPAEPSSRPVTSVACFGRKNSAGTASPIYFRSSRRSVISTAVMALGR